MHSIVIGDLIKYIILTTACIAVGVIAVVRMHGHPLHVPVGWHSPFFWQTAGTDWSAIISDANKKISEDGFSPFGFFFMMMLFKGVFASLAGPAPNYDMQKILSTRSPKEATKMTGFVSIVLLPIRYSLIIGLTALALLNYNQLESLLSNRQQISKKYFRPPSFNLFRQALWVCCSQVCWAHL